MCKTKNDELLLRISELDDELKNAHLTSEYAALQAKTIANITKKKEQKLEAQVRVLKTNLDRTRGINREQLKNVESNYAELIATAEELDVANTDKGARLAELVIANQEKDARAAELVIAKEKLVCENEEKDARLAALAIANQEKDARAAELAIANQEKDARAAELVIANQEKDARAAELVIANKELAFQNDQKEARAIELESAGEKVKATLQEKEVLLREIHHRVKNNLQIISSMLSLQARAEPDAASRKALVECQRRVKVMARIHESLHQSNNVTAVDARDYINAIVADTVDSSQINSQKVKTLVEVDKINIDIDTAIVCGQIFSELFSNCIKHAFPDDRSGSIKVTMRRDERGRMELKVVDDGIGLLEGFNIHKSATLGMKLVGALTTQLNGEINIDGSCGTSVWITFKGKK
jgi:two-component sensor histidine kinase